MVSWWILTCKHEVHWITIPQYCAYTVTVCWHGTHETENTCGTEWVYMNSMFVENAWRAKYTCDMVVDKMSETITSTNEQ